MKLSLLPFSLKLKHVFRIAHGARTTQETLIVQLSDGVYAGYGEAIASPYYQISVQTCIDDIEKVRHLIEEMPPSHPDDFWKTLYPHFRHNLFALCGLNNAAYDLYAQQQRLPLYKALGLDPAEAPISNYTIGIASISEMIKKIEEVPWPVYKIKLGTDHDLDILKALRAHTTARFRVDANCAWTAEETIRYSSQMKKMGVEFIEQPLKADDWKGMKEVLKYSELPIFADESCIKEEDVDKCIEHFHGINIKLTKCGGLTPALRMLHQAKKAGKKVMVGCMTESSVGIAAVAHIAPMLDYVDMDSILLIDNDPAQSITLADGQVSYPKRNGLGIQMMQ